MRLLAVSLLTIFTGQISFVYAAEQSAVLKDEAARLNYSVGYQIGSDFKQQEFEVRPEAVLKGIEDAMSGSNGLMTKQEMRQTMADVGKKVADLKRKKRQQVSNYTEKNKQFLVEMARDPQSLPQIAACNTGSLKRAAVTILSRMTKSWFIIVASSLMALNLIVLTTKSRPLSR